MLVGVVLPFSISRRRAQGDEFADLARHAASRAMLLILLGTVVAAAHGRRLTWPFDWVLPQIALGYVFLFPLAFRPIREAWFWLSVILVGYWLAFALYPLPAPQFDYARVGVSEAWLREFGLSGFAAHWQKNSNLAWAFDVWLQNLLPRAEPFTHFPTGIATLNFIPTIGTMILGLIAGVRLGSDATPWAKVRWLVLVGAALMAAGFLLDRFGLCPAVKWIWSPSWVLFSGGWTYLILAAFFIAVEIWRWKKLAFPLVVVGVNSIAAYLLAQLYPALAFHSLERLVGQRPFMILGEALQPLVYGATVVTGYWLVLYWMYRRRIFLRV